MTTTPAAAADGHIELRPHHVAAVTAGNALEFYDFVTYAFFATEISQVFFPNAAERNGLLYTLLVFGAGFIMRPIGALTIGFLADRLGRKPAMLTSFGLMGAAMIGLAVVPGYNQIGPAAQWLLVFLRLVQGFALGGEVGPSTTFMSEAAPPHERGLYVSMQGFSQNCANLASGVIGFTLSNVLSHDDFVNYGWRIAFGIGIIILPVGIILRTSLAETLHHVHDHPHAELPTPKVRGGMIRLAALGILMLAGGTTITYVGNYLTTFARSTLHMSPGIAFTATIASGIAGLIFGPLSGWLSDRIGRKRMMFIPWLVLALITIPAFAWVINAPSIGSLVGLSLAIGITGSLGSPAIQAALAEMLPKRSRSFGFGLIYAVAISIFGGATQPIVQGLLNSTNNPLMPAFYMTFWTAVALAAMLLFPETAPKHRRQVA